MVRKFKCIYCGYWKNEKFDECPNCYSHSIIPWIVERKEADFEI